MINDEINHEMISKTVGLGFRAFSLGTNELRIAMKGYLAASNATKKGKAVKNPKTGKKTVRELVSEGQGATAIEIHDERIKDFEKIAKKYRVDYAVKKDNTTVPPKYLVFFKAKDTDVISQAFREFVKATEQKKEKLSLRERLQQKIKLANEKKEKDLGKSKHRLKKREKVR